MALLSTSILGVPITTSPKKDILASIEKALLKRKQLIIFTPNPEIVTHAQTDHSLLTALNLADINLPDGKGVGLALGIPTITGRDFVLDLLSIIEKKKGIAYILTGNKNTLEKTLVRAKNEFPYLTVKGAVGPQLTREGIPINSANGRIEQKVLEEIKKIKPDIVFVGFGAPKQEKWISHHKSAHNGTSFMAVGGSFDYYAQLKPLPPQWMSSLGIEWLWRLFHEKGHFKRVVRAVIVFPVLVMLRRDRK